MKYNRYSNVLSVDLEELNYRVNELISKGCSPIGGMVIIQIGQKLFYNQTIVVDSENNNVLGEYEIYKEPSYIEEVRRLAKEGRKLEAVQLYKENTGMGLKESKDWVDSNC
jgi:hypothetical protein